MDVSVIIVNYNTLELTKNTIDSVVEKTKDLSYEIILVDNASTDGSAEFFEKEYKNKITFIKNNENLGFGRANNKGIEIAKGKYVFLLNSDTLLINNAIKILFDFMEKHEEVGVCGGNLYTQNLKPTHSYKKILPNIWTELNNYFNIPEKIILKLLKKQKDFNNTNKNIEVGYITGADMLIRKQILNICGNFDKEIFMYYEEVELSYRIKKLGFKIYNIPSAKIIHLEGKSFNFKEERYRRQIQGKYKCFYKCYGIKSIKKLFYIFNIGLILRYFLTFDKKYLTMKEINKEEYENILNFYN